MSPLRLWYCEYRVDDDGSVRLKVVWEDLPRGSTARHLTFRRIDDLPVDVRLLLHTAMVTSGSRFGTFDFPSDCDPAGLPHPGEMSLGFS